MKYVVVSLASYGVALALSQCASYLFYTKTCCVLAEILYYLSWPLYVLGVLGVFTLGAARELEMDRLSLSENKYRKWSVYNAKQLTHSLYKGSRLTRLKALANVDPASKQKLDEIEQELEDVRSKITSMLSPYISESFSIDELEYLLHKQFRTGKDLLPANIPFEEKQTLLRLYRHENFYTEYYPYDEYHKNDIYIEQILSFVDYNSNRDCYSGSYNAEEFNPHLCLPVDAQLWIFRIPLAAKFIVWPAFVASGLFLIFLVLRWI